MPRTDRRPDQLRPLSFARGYTGSAPGSVLVKAGRTTVLCTCTVEPAVPPFLVGSGMRLTDSLNPQTNLEFESSRALDGGAVEIVYRVLPHR